MNNAGLWVPEGMVVGDNGKLLGDYPKSSMASFWLGGAAAAFLPLRNLVGNYLTALAEFERTGSQEALKTTVNVDQGNAYTPRRGDDDRTPEDLMSRSNGDLPFKEVPPGVFFLLAAIDVQKYGFVVQIVGIGQYFEKWIVDRFQIRKSKRLDEDGDP